MLALYAKALTHKPRNTKTALPVLPTSSRYKCMQINAKHCASYNRLSQWNDNFAAIIHPNYIQTLSLPMQLSMMVDSSFPFKPMGLVHIGNKIDVTRLPEQSARLGLVTTFGDVYWHKKGWLFEVITNAIILDDRRHAGFASNTTNSTDLAELVKDESTVAVKGSSVYLSRCRHNNEQSTFKQQASLTSKESPSWLQVDVHQFDDIIEENPSIIIDLPFSGDVGRKYAKVSGDCNPIHLYAATAKLLGFKTAIAHGMYSKALVFSKLARDIGCTHSSFSIKGVFMQAISLPANTSLIAQHTRHNNVEFSLYSRSKRKQKIHVMGSIDR
jgi:hypothetical protein